MTVQLRMLILILEPGSAPRRLYLTVAYHWSAGTESLPRQPRDQAPGPSAQADASPSNRNGRVTTVDCGTTRWSMKADRHSQEVEDEARALNNGVVLGDWLWGTWLDRNGTGGG